MRDLGLARGLLYRLVLVRQGAVEIRGVQPLVLDGFWGGSIVAVKPKVKDTRIVDYTMTIKLWYGTARREALIELPYLSDKWKLRFPAKGKQ